MREKPVNISFMLSEKTGLETKSIDRLNNRLHDGGELSNHLRKLIIKRLFAQILIKIPN